MPSLNQAQFISDSINSVFNQITDFPFELIVMDGGSEDNTDEILKAVSKKYPDSLRFYIEKDSGPADAINKAIKKAQGGILGWLNSDDLYLPNTINQVVDAYKTNDDLLMLYGYAQHIGENDEDLGFYPTKPPETGFEGFRDSCFICQPTVFFKRELFDEVGYLNESLKTAFDYELWLRIFKDYSYRIGFIPSVLAKSRLHKGNITLSQRELVFKESIQLVARNFQSVPIHWFTTYADEFVNDFLRIKSPVDINDHLFGFFEEISGLLNEEDKRQIKNLLSYGKYSKKEIVKQKKYKPKILTLVHAWLELKRLPEDIKSKYKIIKSSGLFEEQWYLNQYPEVERSMINPIIHYIKYGATEGRKPSKEFDLIRYEYENGDIGLQGIDLYLYYIHKTKTLPKA